MPVPHGVISTSEGPVDPTQEEVNVSDNQTVEEATQDITASEEADATEQEVVESDSELQE